MRSIIIYFAAILGKLLKKMNPNELLHEYLLVLLVYVKSLI